ncbi:MAG: hypothetical protein WBO36_04315 [Saprospiraceae bacterium]
MYKILITNILIALNFAVFGQVKLTQIEKDTVKYRIPVAERTIPGQSGYYLKYATIPALFDSLGMSLTDSIYARNDTIFLRDGTGFIKLAAGWGLDVATSGSTITYKADTSELATQYDLSLKENTLSFNSPLSRSVNTISMPAATTSVSGHLTSTDWNTFNGKVGGSGSNTQVAYWNGANTLMGNSNFNWDNSNQRLTFNGTNYGVNIGHFSGTSTQGLSNTNIGLYNGNILGASNVSNTSIGDQNFWLSGSTASYNVNIGRANYIFGSGSYNVNIGDGVNSGSTSSGNNNVYIGRSVALASGSHYENVGLGYLSLYSVTNGNRNVANGSYSLNSLTIGNENAGIGFYAGGAVVSNSGTVSIGSYANGLTNGGDSNISIGLYAGAKL